jgi:hypothetical protein
MKLFKEAEDRSLKGLKSVIWVMVAQKNSEPPNE